MTSASISSDTGLPAPDSAEATGDATPSIPAVQDREAPAPGVETPDLEPQPGLYLHGREPADGQVRVEISQVALRQIEGHGAGNLGDEVGGVLLGRVWQESQGLTVEILAALPALSEEYGPVHFTFTADAWAGIHTDRSEHYPELKIVGWFHTHPDLGVFYSGDDVTVHSVAFTLPWHVGLVVDPIRGEGCFFAWQSGEVPEDQDVTLAPLPGFFELLDEQPTSAAGWRLVRSAVWQHGGYTVPGRSPDSQIYVPDAARPTLPPINPWWGVLLGGLSLLISIILLLERLLGS